MKRTGMRLTAVAAVTALLLGGCGEQPYSLTEDEEGMIVDYSAHAVAKFNTSQPDGLANVSRNEQETEAVDESQTTETENKITLDASGNAAAGDQSTENKTAKMQKKNIAVEILNQALKDYVEKVGIQNIVMQEKFSTKFQKIATAYNERTSVEDIEKIIQEMINLKNEIEKELAAGNEYNLSVEEKAFFDALGNDPQVKELMQDDTLVKIAKELVDTINSNMTIDWDIRKDARARMRYEIKKLLIKYDYPPVKRDSAVQLVIRQAELQCKGMIEEN